MTISNRYFTHGLAAAVACLGALKLMAADTTTLDKKEVAFIKDAAQGGQAEVEIGKLAEQNGQNDRIKRLGKLLQQDHSKANQELMQIAQKENVNIPPDTTRKENRMSTKLQGKTGADFDKAFAEHAIVDHEKDIRKFQRAQQECKNPELKAFIAKTLPTLKEHLEAARMAGAAVGVDPKTLAAADRVLSDETGQGTSGADLNQSGSQRHDSTTTPKTTTPTPTAPKDANK